MNAHVSIQAPAPLAYEPCEVQAFIDSTEPTCAAHTAYATEDAQHLEYIARELVSFWWRSSARYSAMSYATKAFDAADYLDRLIDQAVDDLTADAETLFRRFVELYAAEY